MFEKFGEFDSAEEINTAAAAQLAEGDHEAIKTIALENGLDEADAEDYINGDVKELCNPLMAALGKLEIEAAQLTPYEIMEDWVQYIKVNCQENEAMAAAVRKKGRSLKGCIAKILKWSLKNAKDVDKDILKECGITYKVQLGIPGTGTARKIITEYYLGGENT